MASARLFMTIESSALQVSLGISKDWLVCTIMFIYKIYIIRRMRVVAFGIYLAVFELKYNLWCINFADLQYLRMHALIDTHIATLL